MSRENAQRADGYRRNRLGDTLALLMYEWTGVNLRRFQAVMFDQFPQ